MKSKNINKKVENDTTYEKFIKSDNILSKQTQKDVNESVQLHYNIKSKSYGKTKHIHFVGIGGVSMSSLAVWALMQGYKVTGSDMVITDTTKQLETYGINIIYKHEKQNVINADMVVYSNATDNSCEVLSAKMLGIKTLSRAEYLATMLKEYKNKICVSGAHGKTTTTALIYSILHSANKQPSLHLGGNLCENGKNFSYANKDFIACEACEYKDAFLALPTSVGVILNIAPEHLDYFKDYSGVLKSFKQFAKNSKNLVINYDFYNKNAVFYDKNEKKHKKVITFGLNNGDYIASNISQNLNGTYSFDCLKNGKFFAHINLNLVGKHNIVNALAAIAACDFYGIAKEYICAGLQNFKGVQRRFEHLHKTKFIVHDYAHHPDEITATLTETFGFYYQNKNQSRNNYLYKSKYEKQENFQQKDIQAQLNKNISKKLLVVFQPHTYSRTKTLFTNFINCFSNVNELVLLKTYSAREKYDYKGSACYLSKKIGQKAKYFGSKQKAKDYILQKLKQGYGVLFLGAGDIYAFAKIVAKLC